MRSGVGFPFPIGTQLNPEEKLVALLKEGKSVMLVKWQDGSSLTYAGPTGSSVRITELGDRAASAVDSEELIWKRLLQANPPPETSFIEYLKNYVEVA
jgi:hypothetical protein